REGLPSPGVGLRHYAPRARLILVEGSLSELPARLSEAAKAHERARIGVMLPAELANVDLGTPLRAGTGFAWGRWSAPQELAEKLYAGLRALDAQGCDVILCPVPELGGIGDAIRDRLRKAASSA
ncbi:MAG TPA: Sua5 family C-terminal domain-containing protein, partial [Terracidiphilus sp.]|nr:Sua5 family C-terminal domain-containing protein [Terracidiphilus sp.]